MMIRRIEGCTNVIGQEQGYLGLPIRVREVNAVIAGVEHSVIAVESAWEPTPQELELIQAGHSIVVQLLGALPHPPISVLVADTPMESVEKAQESVESLLEQMENLLEYYRMRPTADNTNNRLLVAQALELIVQVKQQ